jgi:hypothetical protein
VQEHFARHLRDDEVQVVHDAMQRISGPPTRRGRP